MNSCLALFSSCFLLTPPCFSALSRGSAGALLTQGALVSHASHSQLCNKMVSSTGSWLRRTKWKQISPLQNISLHICCIHCKGTFTLRTFQQSILICSQRPQSLVWCKQTEPNATKQSPERSLGQIRAPQSLFDLKC